MDLLKGPIRDGSRGGRGDFKWDDIKSDKDRENYLGHSLMAPVGRWQQGKDLTWYAKKSSGGGNGSVSAQQQEDEAKKARAEELRRIKEAENDALSAALGFAVTRRRTDAGVSQSEVERAIKEGGAGNNDTEPGAEEGKGVGFGKMGLRAMAWSTDEKEVMEGQQSSAAISNNSTNLVPAKTSDRKRHSSEDGHSHRRHRHHGRDNERGKHDRSHRHHRHRSRSRSPRHHRHRDSEREDNRGKRRDRSRDRDRSKERHKTRDRSQERDRSKDRYRSHRHSRDDKHERKRERPDDRSDRSHHSRRRSRERSR